MIDYAAEIKRHIIGKNNNDVLLYGLVIFHCSVSDEKETTKQIVDNDMFNVMNWNKLVTQLQLVF